MENDDIRKKKTQFLVKGLVDQIQHPFYGMKEHNQI